MDEENIYDDLDDFLLDQRVEKVQENNKELQETFQKLEETTKKFNEDIANLKKINQNLEVNISALFKTAKSELDRKDKKIADLHRELDNLKFKRAAPKPAKPPKPLKPLKPPKPEENQTDLKKELEQKNRIIQSLTKQLESDERKNLKRNSSHIEDDDLRSRLSLGKKRKLDEPPRSRFDKKRTIRRHRSGSLDPPKSREHKSRRYSRSRSRSPPNRKHIRSRHPDNRHRQNKEARSSSMDRKKVHHNNKNSLIQDLIKIKEDSGVSSSNSHTSEVIAKPDTTVNIKESENKIATETIVNIKESENKIENVDLELEEGEIDCTLEDIISDDDIMCKEKTKLLEPCKINPKDDVLELMVQSNYLDDLDIDAEISKMRDHEDEKRKKRKEDKHRISKLKTAISECKQNIEILEHKIYDADETETEDEFNKTTSTFNVEQNNLVLKISKKKSDEPKTELKESEMTENIPTDIVDVVANNNITTNGSIEHHAIENKLNDLFNVEIEKENKEVDLTEKDSMAIVKSTENEVVRKAPLKAKRRRAFICIT